MSFVPRWCVLAGAGVLLALGGGCSGPSTAQAHFTGARLEGAVTLDGKPVDDGYVQFVPASKDAGPVTQAAIVQGRYVASKVPLGKVTAMIIAKPPEPPADVTSAYQPPPLVLIPERYQKGIPVEVKEDKNDLDFDMSSKK